MKKSVLLVLFIVLSKSGMWAQKIDNANNSVTAPVPPLKKYAHIATNANTANSSDYYNRDTEITGWMIDGVIPQDFPKYTIGTSKEKYDAIIDIWVKNNSSKVKPAYRKNSITTEK